MYDLRGTFLEACDCDVICPCWVGESPDRGECAGTIAWYVEQGTIDAVDVSGLLVVSVSRHTGHRDGGGWEVVLFVDHRVDEEQGEALERVFTGDAGGPLRELGALTGEVLAVRRAAIELTSDGRRTTLAVGDAVTAESEPLIGSTGRVTTLADSALGTVLGTPAEIGKAASYRLGIDEHDFSLDVEGTSANRGRFHYLHGSRS